MIITDGKNTIKLEVRCWEGTRYGEDYSNDICEDMMERDEEFVAYEEFVSHVDDIEFSVNAVLDLCQEDIAEHDCHVFVDDIDISDCGYWVMND